jgi:biopolymer transport protein ExbB
MVDFIYAVLRTVTGWIGLEQVLIDSWEAIRDFLELGGDVLFLIGVLMVFMWILIFERLFYLITEHRNVVKDVLNRWEARSDRKSWNAHMIRERMLSEVRAKTEGSIPIIHALVALCPLMGLLGTVTGMIEVFHVMAVSGSGNARSMASGVAKATIPTMAGMVAALSGMFIAIWLQGRASTELEILDEHLTMDH